MDYSTKINELEDKIRENRTKGIPVDCLIKQQIELFQKAHDEMLEIVKNKGIAYNLNIAEAEIAQLSAIITLSEQIGEPTDSYKSRITEIEKEFVGDNVTIEFND